MNSKAENMRDDTKAREELIEELEELRKRISELRISEVERKHASEAMEKAHSELERCIEERATELVRANEQLKQEIEERKKTEEELKRTKEYLENVIENSVDAIGIVDRQGRFILWNRRAAAIYGYNFDELAGKLAFDLYADREELGNMLKRLRKHGVVRECEILMRKKDESIVPMDISISLLKDDRGETIGSVCVARDLSERKKAEMELKRAKEELSRYSRELERQVRERTREITSILKYTPAVVYIKDSKGYYTLVNSRYEELFGIKNEDIQGKSDYHIFPREVADQLRKSDHKVLTEKRHCQVEERIPHGNGIHTYLSVKFPLYDEKAVPTGVCGILTDITEIKRAQDQMRRLSANIMNSQEKERAAIARELHDELGQMLTALRMDSVWMQKRLREVDSEAAERALSMCELIDKTIDGVRGMATRLRPGVLDDLGLIDALEWYTADFEKRTGISCVFKSINVQKVPDTVATAAYRIVQEALTNVARHSFASHVRVFLEEEENSLSLFVEDNGHGFKLPETGEFEGLGMAGMRERAGLAGGNLEIQSLPERGTTVRCTLPIDGQCNGVSLREYSID